MMKIQLTICSLLIFLLVGCVDDGANQEKYRQEILEVETSFAKMASSEGVKKAFLHFAAEDAVLNREEKIIKGKTGIRDYFDKQNLLNVKLEWSPDFIDVAASGDLAYTYGNYTFSAIDESGNEINANGIFHTIWKRQADGSWKFVYD